MSMKKKIAALLMVVFVLLLNVAILCRKETQVEPVTLHFTVLAEQEAEVTVFYSPNTGFSEAFCETVRYTQAGSQQQFAVTVLSNAQNIRIDFDGAAKYFSVSQLSYSYGDHTQLVDVTQFESENLLVSHSVSDYSVIAGSVNFVVADVDPYIAAAVGPTEIGASINALAQKEAMVKNIIIVLILDLACLVVLRFRNKFLSLPIELLQNRALIFNLAKNDFKTKFAGSYLGIFWAFVQPIVTVVVYWFVFQVGLRSGNMNDYPFVLWLVAGLVPWFFFQEALFGGTNALVEYSYLVKKVVFKISTLPLVKVISALFVHAFFIAFTLILYSCYGFFPDLYTLQIIYYSFALFVLVLGICYTTCAIVIFFRDLTQIINIILQVGVWVTPIMWNIEDMAQRMPRALVLIMKANPLYYIVNGYRDALLNKVWFWERFDLTCLYWFVTAAVFALGAIIFKRLKVHFADVL